MNHLVEKKISKSCKKIGKCYSKGIKLIKNKKNTT